MSRIKRYTLFAMMWIFVFPITGTLGLSFLASGIIAALAGVVRFILNIFGIDFGLINIFDYRFGSFTELLISLAVGCILFFVGNQLWKLTKQLFHWMQKHKEGRPGKDY